MKIIKQVIADEGHWVSTDGKTFSKVVWCGEEMPISQVKEITDEEYDGIKRVFDEQQQREFVDGQIVKPNGFYWHNGHRYVYVGMHDTTAETWEQVADDMEQFDEE